MHYRGAKRNMNILHIDATAKIKRSKLKTEFAWKIRPVARSIPVQTIELDIPATLDDAVGLNQTAVTATRPSLDLTTVMCLIICKDKNWMDPVMLNILCILTDMYNISQANNIFYRAL